MAEIVTESMVKSMLVSYGKFLGWSYDRGQGSEPLIAQG